MSDKAEARLIDLEVKLAYQEDTIDTLNQEIIRQQHEIDALKRHLTRVNAQIEHLAIQENRGQHDKEGEVVHEIPPHY